MMKMKLQLAVVLLLTPLALMGCATNAQTPNDPFEKANRAIFGFNEAVDCAVLAPVARGYQTVVPELLRAGVTNFFGSRERSHRRRCH